MLEYRAYLLGPSGHISDAAVIIREATDEAAINIAKALVDNPRPGIVAGQPTRSDAEALQCRCAREIQLKLYHWL